MEQDVPKRQKVSISGTQKASQLCPLTLEALPKDLLELVTDKLGMGVYTLRMVSRGLAGLEVPPAAKLACVALKAWPNVPNQLHRSWRPPITDGRSGRIPGYRELVWKELTYREARQWRNYWASLVLELDRAPVGLLLDAYALVWAANMAAFRACHKRYAHSERKKCEHYHAVRRVMKYVLQDRMWPICSGKDVYNDEQDRPVVQPMSHVAVRDTVARMIEEAHLWWDDSAFFYTKYGWLGFTPFMLAAERHNLPLVEYLYKTLPNEVTIDATSQAGNNAYTLCKAWLERKRFSPKQIEQSMVLQFLASTGMDRHLSYVSEYAAHRGE